MLQGSQHVYTGALMYGQRPHSCIEHFQNINNVQQQQDSATAPNFLLIATKRQKVFAANEEMKLPEASSP